MFTGGEIRLIVGVAALLLLGLAVKRYRGPSLPPSLLGDEAAKASTKHPAR